MRNLKSDLIEAAVDLLETDGAEAVSLRRVAGAAGVSHMAPYRHFDNKDALLAAIAETGFRDLVAAIDAAVAAEREDALKSRAIGTAYIGFARTHPALYRLMFGPYHADATRFPGLAEATTASMERCFRAISLLAPTEGRPAGAAPEALGIAVWSMVHGLAHLLIDGQLDTEPETEDTLVEQVLNVLGRAIAATPAEGADG